MNTSNKVLIIGKKIAQDNTLVKHLNEMGFGTFNIDSHYLKLNTHICEDANLILLSQEISYSEQFKLCKNIHQYSNAIVIGFSKSKDINFCTKAIKCGFADYFLSPINTDMVLAKIKMFYHLAKQMQSSLNKSYVCYAFSDVILNPQKQTLLINSKQYVLDSNEYKILYALVKNANRILSREQLLDKMCVNDNAPFDRIVDVYISRLRKKLSNSSIQTIRNAGYMLVTSVKEVQYAEEQ